MDRKIIAMILTGIISVLLITGCSSKNEGKEVSGTDTTQAQEETAAKPADSSVILPADARIGIAYAQDSSEFTTLFLNKVQGNLVAAGIPEESIERSVGSKEELADIAQELISSGCSVLMVGNADENNAPGITDAALKAGIPVLYFGTSPGEKEISRWKDKEMKAAFVGSTFANSAAKRAELIDNLGLEKADFDEDGEIGIAVLSTGEEMAGDQVNADTLKSLEELGVSFFELTPDDEEDVYKGTDREESKDQVITWMSDYGKELDIILCADDSQALGAAEAVNEEKKRVGHDVLIMGFDAYSDSLQEAAAGKIFSTFFNDFMDQSQNASNTVLAFLKGAGADQSSMISEYVSVTVDNAQEILDIAGKMQENESDSEDINENE